MNFKLFAVDCSCLQLIAVVCSGLQLVLFHEFKLFAVDCSCLQLIAVDCSCLQLIAVVCSWYYFMNLSCLQNIEQKSEVGPHISGRTFEKIEKKTFHYFIKIRPKNILSIQEEMPGTCASYYNFFYFSAKIATNHTYQVLVLIFTK